MVIFFDIDGTLIDDSTQKIPESTLRAVERLRENGHIAVVNTGRPYSHIDARVREMPFRGWVCGCGMEVMLDGQWLRRSHPSQALCDRTVECAERNAMRMLYETAEGEVVLDEKSSRNPWIREEIEKMRGKGFPVLHIREHKRFMKMVAFSEPDSQTEDFIRELEGDYTIIDRGHTMLELVLKGNSKAAGMQLVLDTLGADRSHAFAVGDSTNDLPMFRLAEHTICMGNGMAELKREAEYVTDTVLNDGVEKALKHFGLI